MRRSFLVGALLAATALTLAAQGGRRFFRGDLTTEPNPKYDGRYTFARIRYQGYCRMGPEGPGWMHDYPRAERNLMKILAELTSMKPMLDSSSVITFEDPELFKYPVAYVSEPGCWPPTDAEIDGARKFLLKGGFLIFDDFGGSDWNNLEEQMRRVLPDGQWVQLEFGHTVYDSFFRIDNLEALAHDTPGQRRGSPEYWGIYEDNNPGKRLMVVANYNNDIGDAWQFSDQGFVPIDLANEAYKLGVNYIVYGITH